MRIGKLCYAHKLSKMQPALKNQSTRQLLRAFSSWSFAIKNAKSPQRAWSLYAQMQSQAIPVDSFTILFNLQSCTELRNLPLICHLHSHLLKLGFNIHVYVATSLLNAYSGTSFECAHKLFDEIPVRNTVTWNTMITCFSRSGDVKGARKMFDQMPLRDLASWSAMIAGYMSNGHWEEGVALFQEMVMFEQLKPDQVTIGPILAGCSEMGSIGLLLGKSVHGFVVKNHWELNVELGTCLVDMYAKCGFLNFASLVFDMMKDRNVVTWTALICGAAKHGFGTEALDIFKKMRQGCVLPNEFTFTGVLSACVQAGLVDEGRGYFKMIEECGLKPTIQHYGCMVDLFGKAGLLGEAYEVINTMSPEPNIVIWGSFLSSCKLHKQFEMAERVIERVMNLVRPENDGGVYTLISDLYVLGGKWAEAERVRQLMLHQHVRKARGCSFIRNNTT